MKMSKEFLAAIGAVVALSAPQAAQAGSSQIMMTAQIQITASCTISASTLDFGSMSFVNSPINQQGSLNVLCTNQTPYQVGLDAGTAAGSTVANRFLSDGTATIPFFLYRDAQRSNNWGNTQGTDTYAGTGNGASQSIPVYGVVPVMATAPAPGTYSTTIVATVYF